MPQSETTARILVADDDQVSCHLLDYLLTGAGYTVTTANGGRTAGDTIEKGDYHLLIADVGMPQGDGLSLCRRLREAHNPIPVLIVSGRHHADDKVAAFDAGCDDFLAKPYDPRELLARIGALLKRRRWGTARQATVPIRVGNIELDENELSVKLPTGMRIQLSPTEGRVLSCLMINAGRVVTRDLLLREAWGYDYESDSNQIEVYIRRIRRKIDADSAQSTIETVRGLGYRFMTPSQLAAARTAPAPTISGAHLPVSGGQAPAPTPETGHALSGAVAARA